MLLQINQSNGPFRISILFEKQKHFIYYQDKIPTLQIDTTLQWLKVKWCRNNVISVRWAAREQGEGEMTYETGQIGEFTFSTYGTKLEGWIDGSYGKLFLSGEKIKENDGRDGLHLQNEWSTYNDSQYDYERINRWR